MRPLGSPKTNTITKAVSKFIDEGHHFNKWGHWSPRKPASTITETLAKTNSSINGATGLPENQNNYQYKHGDNHFSINGAIGTPEHQHDY